jgi:hypothetical protein
LSARCRFVAALTRRRRVCPKASAPLVCGRVAAASAVPPPPSRPALGRSRSWIASELGSRWVLRALYSSPGAAFSRLRPPYSRLALTAVGPRHVRRSVRSSSPRRAPSPKRWFAWCVACRMFPRSLERAGCSLSRGRRLPPRPPTASPRWGLPPALFPIRRFQLLGSSAGEPLRPTSRPCSADESVAHAAVAGDRGLDTSMGFFVSNRLRRLNPRDEGLRVARRVS